MKRIALNQLIVFLLLIHFNNVFGQEGNFYLKHYSNYLEGTDNFIYSIQQGNDKAMYFANTRGIISYDGELWRLTKTVKTPLSIHNDTATGFIYGCFTNEIGFFETDTKGHLIYNSIVCPRKDFEEITEIYSTDDFVFFCNRSIIFQVDKKTQKLQNYIQASANSYDGFYSFKNKFYVNLGNRGIHVLKGKSLVPVRNGKISTEGLSFGVQVTPSIMLLGTSDNELFFFDGNAFRKFIPEASSYLKETIISNAVLISKHELAVSTLAGGCIIISLRSGKTINILNYQTGLPDNEIYSIGKDNYGGIWIAHEYGLTRIDTHIPFRNYSSYSGLDGHILSVFNHKTNLYVTTSEGVYYLTKAATGSQKYFTPEIKEKKTSGNLFYNILKKKNYFSLYKKKIEAEKFIAKNHKSNKQNNRTSEHGYYYKKIEGIHGKCRQVISFNHRLLVASNKGLYEIENFTGKPVIKESYIHCIYASKYFPGVFVSADDQVYLIEESNSKWSTTRILESPLGFSSIDEDSKKNIWLGSNGKVLKISLSNKARLKDSKLYSFPEVSYENILVKNISNKICFISSTGIFNYDSAKDSLHPDLEYSQHDNHIFRTIGHQEGLTWIKSDSGWVRLKNNSEERRAFPIFSMLKNIQHIYQDDLSNIWLVDEHNHLYKLNENYKNLYNPFNVHLREVKNNQGHKLSLTDLNLEYKNNSLKFFLAAPFFVGEDHIHYQYYLEGTMSDWSAWTKDHKIEFAYLPSGEYNLILRAKNVFGQITETRNVPFKIFPPYWKTTWFFILEFLFFVSLLIISINLNRNRHSDFLTKAITFLTLIITIEFIVFYVESVITVGDADPFIRFGLNVMLALLISPIEKILEAVLSKRKRSLARIFLFLRKKHWPSL